MDDVQPSSANMEAENKVKRVRFADVQVREYARKIGGGGGVISYLENPTDSIGYLLNDNQIETPPSKFSEIDTASDFIRLDSREYRAQYVQIPVTLKMKTNDLRTI